MVASSHACGPSVQCTETKIAQIEWGKTVGHQPLDAMRYPGGTPLFAQPILCVKSDDPEAQVFKFRERYL